MWSNSADGGLGTTNCYNKLHRELGVNTRRYVCTVLLISFMAYHEFIVNVVLGVFAAAYQK